MSHVDRSCDMKMLQESDSMRSKDCDWNKSQNNICGCKISKNMDIGCQMLQVVKLLTTVISNFDCTSQKRNSEEKRDGENCDCRSQGRSFKEKRKRQRGGKGSRMRRNARRAESRAERLPPPDQDLEWDWTLDEWDEWDWTPPPDQPQPPTAPPDPPPRTTSLIQDICGMIDKPTPEVPPKLKDEMKELQSKIVKGLRSLSDVDKEIDNRLLQLKLPPKQDLDFVTVNPGQATEKKTLDPG